MSIETVADSLIARAQPLVDEGQKDTALAAEIRAFLTHRAGILSSRSNESYLEASGSGERVILLWGAVQQLEGGYAPAQEQRSEWGAGLKTWASDNTSFHDFWSQQAKDTAAKYGAAIGNAIGAGADSAAGNALKSPAVLAALVVGVVLAGAWAWRSFK